tara:strand:+ start:437 stop:667 length:231 start_codon:yes stop_codon:yes gene_type:complete
MYAKNNDDIVSQKAIRSLIVKEGITYAQAEYYLKTGLHIDAQEAPYASREADSFWEEAEESRDDNFVGFDSYGDDA